MNWHKKLIKLSAAKNKINAMGITDPSLKLFIHRYEDVVGQDWGKIKSSDDLENYITQTLMPSLATQMDATAENNNFLKPQHIDIPKEHKENPDDPVLNQAYQIYIRGNQEQANNAYLKHLNFDKKNAFEQWSQYLTKEEPYNSNPAFQYSVLKPIVDSSPEATKAGPPPLNSEALAMIWEDINDNNVTQMNILKKYKKLASKLDKEGIQSVESSGGAEWIRIPSKVAEPENYDKNLKKLQSFSQGTGWCVARQHHSNQYLSQGDFWLHLENGKPNVAIRLVGNKVQEIRGLNNDIKQLEPYWEDVTNFLKKTQFEYEENEQYQHIKKIYLMNANLEKGSENYNTVVGMIQKDHTAWSQLSEQNRAQFPELLGLAKQGYARELNSYLIKMEAPGLSENQYMTNFDGFTDYYESLAPEIKTALGDMQPRIIEAHKKAFHNNPIILTEFPPEMQQMFSLKDQEYAWSNYIDQDPYHYNDSRIPDEVRRTMSTEFLKEQWGKLIQSNPDHIDNIPPELRDLWGQGELEGYILADFARYPLSRKHGHFNKLERMERLVQEGRIQRPQMIEALTNAITANPKWMQMLPAEYRNEILLQNQNVGNIVQRDQVGHATRDTNYFTTLNPAQQEELLATNGVEIGQAFANNIQQSYGNLHEFWVKVPENVREHLPSEIIGNVAQYYADLLARDPSNFDNIFSKIPPDIQGFVFSKMASRRNWFGRLK